MYIDFHFTPRRHHVDSFNQHEITRFNFVITLREFWNCFETFNYVCIAFSSTLLFIRKRRLKFLCNVFCNVIHLLISNNTYVCNICCVHCFIITFYFLWLRNNENWRLTNRGSWLSRMFLHQFCQTYYYLLPSSHNYCCCLLSLAHKVNSLFSGSSLEDKQ